MYRLLLAHGAVPRKLCLAASHQRCFASPRYVNDTVRAHQWMHPLCCRKWRQHENHRVVIILLATYGMGVVKTVVKFVLCCSHTSLRYGTHFEAMVSCFVHGPIASLSSSPSTSSSPTCTRRELFIRSAISLPVVSTLLLDNPAAVLADRTGRFSTRLTARRRYLPRVRSGVDAVRARAAGDTSYPLISATMTDLLPPAQLLASGSVGEGAAAAPTRARLKEALSRAEGAAKRADTDSGALQELLSALEEYEEAVGLSDTLPAS